MEGFDMSMITDAFKTIGDLLGKIPWEKVLDVLKQLFEEIAKLIPGLAK